MKRKKYVIVNMSRFYTFITLLFILCAILLFTIIYSPKAHSSIYEPRYKEYHIGEGDSLWDIALNNMPEGYDVRKMIYEIKKANNMETSYIYAGDTIKIPQNYK